MHDFRDAHRRPCWRIRGGHCFHIYCPDGERTKHGTECCRGVVSSDECKDIRAYFCNVEEPSCVQDSAKKSGSLVTAWIDLVDLRLIDPSDE